MHALPFSTQSNGKCEQFGLQNTYMKNLHKMPQTIEKLYVCMCVCTENINNPMETAETKKKCSFTYKKNAK